MEVGIGEIFSRVSVVPGAAAVAGPAVDRIVEMVLQRLQQQARRDRHLDQERSLFAGVVSAAGRDGD
jgi:hypothetical protein